MRLPETLTEPPIGFHAVGARALVAHVVGQGHLMMGRLMSEGLKLRAHVRVEIVITEVKEILPTSNSAARHGFNLDGSVSGASEGPLSLPRSFLGRFFRCSRA